MSVDHRGPDRDDRARMVGRRAEGASLLTRRTFALVLAIGRGITLITSSMLGERKY